MENLFTPNSIRTVSGMYVNFLDPDPETILIHDIVHALSNIPRFGGHLPDWNPLHSYSVLQHSIHCAMITPLEERFDALMHDTPEAYLLDIPSPLKKLLPDYQVIEKRFSEVISKKFGFMSPMKKHVKLSDEVMLHMEWKVLMLGEPTDKPFKIMSKHEARSQFMNLFNSLSKQN